MPDDHRPDISHQSTAPAQNGSGPRIAILGAGFSGLGMAIRLRQEGFDNFTIYEKADEVGGTWRENVYPGVACDVPSHLYSFSFEPNPNWTRRYSPGGEIWDYTIHCARKYDLYRSIEFGKAVSTIRHDGKEWCVNFSDGRTATADFVISGLGGLHVPNTPDIPGKDEFAGPVFHTAQWRDDVELTGRRVAIIGSAASAVQIIPEIVDKVAHLDVYQRTPNWIFPRMSYAYPVWLRNVFEKVPLLARAYRGFYFNMLEWRFQAFHKNENYVKRHIRTAFDKRLAAQPYLMGDALSVLDIAWFVYANRLALGGYPLARLHPRVNAWVETLRARPEFSKEVAMPPEAVQRLEATRRAHAQAGKSLEQVAGL